MGDAKQAEDPRDMERMVMDQSAKSSPMWWAQREIRTLREDLSEARALLDRCLTSEGTCLLADLADDVETFLQRGGGKGKA